MNFDKDLRKGGQRFSILAGLSILASLVHAWQHNWALAVTTALCALTSLVVRASLKWQQRTRDEVRIALAGVQAMMEYKEHKEI